MKVLRGISLFFLYPFTLFVLGFWGGIKMEHFFYPGESGKAPQSEMVSVKQDDVQVGSAAKAQYEQYDMEDDVEERVFQGSGDGEDSHPSSGPEARMASTRGETLSVDTEYVLLETDILHGTEVETSWRLPGQYIGMDREQFLVAIENYSSYPPLSEMERGFVSAEVESFARERVVVRKNYHSVQLDEGFYLAAADHEVVVYMEDKETVYMDTGILLEELPEEVQLQVMQMLYLEDEEALYSFLETYTS